MDPNHDIEGFLRIVKLQFNIHEASPVGFRRQTNEDMIVIMRTADLWLLSDEEVPEYDLVARDRNGEPLTCFFT